jgi:hypothetical protein
MGRMQGRTIAIGFLALLVLGAGDPRIAASLAVLPIPSPAGLDSGQPQLSSSGRGVLLSWIERAGPRASLRFAERTGDGWSEPRTVASGDDWFVNWADVPSVTRLPDGALAAHWLQKSGPDTYAYDVRLSYSRDDGRSWVAPFTPHHDGTRTEHGFASLLPMPAGGLAVLWLDGREMQGATHDGHPRGAMTVRFATFDERWQQTSEALVDARVCECCPTAAALTADGPIAAFRNRSEQEVRDIHVARLDGGRWTPSSAVHEDGWTIPACPVNGPALSAQGRDVAIAWFTVREEQGRAFAAFSRDAGRTFGPPIRLDDSGSLGRVDVELLPDGRAVAAWIEFADQRATFRARVVHPSGALAPAVTIAGVEGGRASGYPRVSRHGEELIFAWTESAGGRLSVKTASARFDRSRP